MTLTITPLPDIPFIQPGDDLVKVILQALGQVSLSLSNDDILVITSKIVSKAEGRLVNLATVSPSSQACELSKKVDKDPRLLEIILQESKEVLRIRPGVIIVEHRLGFVCANAGIDHSNVRGEDQEGEEWVLLLPENPDLSAAKIRRGLETASGSHIGILIIDSHGRAWRMGTVGVTVGLSGLPGLADLRGWQDLFGYVLRVTQVGVADELAAAASLVMGQAGEGTPVVHVRGFPYDLRESTLGELIRPKELDLFR